MWYKSDAKLIGADAHELQGKFKIMTRLKTRLCDVDGNAHYEDNWWYYLPNLPCALLAGREWVAHRRKGREISTRHHQLIFGSYRVNLCGQPHSAYVQHSDTDLTATVTMARASRQMITPGSLKKVDKGA